MDEDAKAEFLSLGKDQITFINHLVINGMMKPEALFEPPFTDRHHEGVAGVVPDIAEAIVETITRMNENAVAA